MTDTTHLEASFTDFSEGPPQEVTSSSRTWISRGANFVVCYSEVKEGALLTRSVQEDEYMLFSLDANGVVTCTTESTTFSSETLVIIPPGVSEVRCTKGGRLLRLFSTRDTNLAAMAGNAQHYDNGADGVAPLVSWPPPVDGFRLRVYDVNQYVRSDSRMRIFRSSNLMLNIMLPRDAARDTRTLSPHSHPDFEQGSLAIEGEWVHHLRHPWTSDLSEWREDQHIQVGSPSLIVIPPQVIHTSRNISPGRAWLFDIFSPPRLDFSLKPGMISNGDAYPLPDGSIVS